MIAHLTGPMGPVIELVWPRRCAGCDQPGVALCARCLPAASLALGQRAGVPVLACGEYAGALRRAVLAYKERGRRELAAPFGAALRRAVCALPDPPTSACLVPVPSSRAAVRRRGGDRTRALARRAAAAGSAPSDHRSGHPAAREPSAAPALAAVPALRLVRPVADSAGLGARDRHLNLNGAFAARAPTGEASAVIVDDVLTTGATLAEAARALRSAGWAVHAAVVVAATPGRRR